MKNRFDLEQEILDCWHITDDLGVLLEEVLEGNPSKDEISNILLGLKELYHLKFNRTFNTFETLIQDGQVT